MLSTQKVKVCTAEFEVDCPHCHHSLTSSVDIELDRDEIATVINKLKARLWSQCASL